MTTVDDNDCKRHLAFASLTEDLYLIRSSLYILYETHNLSFPTFVALSGMLGNGVKDRQTGLMEEVYKFIMFKQAENGTVKSAPQALENRVGVVELITWE